jgi:hypothetical protein
LDLFPIVLSYYLENSFSRSVVLVNSIQFFTLSSGD